MSHMKFNQHTVAYMEDTELPDIIQLSYLFKT